MDQQLVYTCVLNIIREYTTAINYLRHTLTWRRCRCCTCRRQREKSCNKQYIQRHNITRRRTQVQLQVCVGKVLVRVRNKKQEKILNGKARVNEPSRWQSERRMIFVRAKINPSSFHHKRSCSRQKINLKSNCFPFLKKVQKVGVIRLRLYYFLIIVNK